MGGSRPPRSLIDAAAGVTVVEIAVVRAALVGRADLVARVLAVRDQVVKSVPTVPLDRALQVVRLPLRLAQPTRSFRPNK